MGNTDLSILAEEQTTPRTAAHRRAPAAAQLPCCCLAREETKISESAWDTWQAVLRITRPGVFVVLSGCVPCLAEG